VGTTVDTTDPRERLEALRELLKQGTLSTQDELREKLGKMRFQVTQSTVSRDLRKIGAVKAIDPEGRTVYRLPEEAFEPVVASQLSDMVRSIQANQSMIVIHTTIGSASLVARHLDLVKPAEILGTIAGDDTIFVAPNSRHSIRATIAQIERAIREIGS
jgi:transcriptional regulator of arginine metabolism